MLFLSYLYTDTRECHSKTRESWTTVLTVTRSRCGTGSECGLLRIGRMSSAQHNGLASTVDVKVDCSTLLRTPGFWYS